MKIATVPYPKQDWLKPAIDPLQLSPAIYLDADTLVLDHGSQVLKWHDLSGNGRHYVGVSATAPTIANGFNNGRNSVHFNATTKLAYTYTGSSTSWSITMLLRPEVDSTLLAWSQNGIGKFFAINNKFPEFYREGLYALTELTEEVADKWLVMTVRVVGTSCKLYVGRNQVASATIGSGVLLGEYLGWATSYGWIGKIAKVFIKDGAITDTQLSDLVESFSNDGGISDQVFVYCEGDSLTYGTAATDDAGYPVQLMRQRKAYRTYNAGVPGSLIAGAVTRQTAANYHALRLGGSNVYVAWVGTNDTNAGTAAATTIAAYAALCTSARGAGYKVIAATQISRNDAYSTNRNTFNASIRANYATYADGLCDLAILSELSDYTNTTYYHADGVHLIDAGHYVVTKAMETAIDALDLLPDPIRLAEVTATTDGIPAPIQVAIDAAGSVATDAIWDAAGDIVVGSGANTAARLAIGTSGYVLTSNGTTAAWSAAADGTPTAITVANEASDATCFVGFFVSDTGDLSPKTNAGLTFNSSTGALGATTVNAALNGTLGATTPASVAGTTGTFSGTVTALNLVAGSGSFGVINSTADAVCWSGGKLGWESTGGVTTSSIATEYFQRSGAGAIAVRKSGGLDCNFTAGAITASGTVTAAALNGTLGATTPAAATVTTLTASGVITGAGGFSVSSSGDVTLGTNGALIFGSDRRIVCGTSGTPLDFKYTNGAYADIRVDDLTAGGAITAASLNLGGATVTDILSATATLNFSSIAAGGFEDLTITVTGAAVGDTVIVNSPAGTNNVTIKGDCWATDTVNVRASNNNLTTAQDPPSGTYRATVIKF